jgi:hypothetical protein
MRTCKAIGALGSGTIATYARQLGTARPDRGQKDLHFRHV